MAREVRVANKWIRIRVILVWLILLAAISLYAYYFEEKYTLTTWVMAKKDPPSQAVLNLRELLFIAAPVLTFLFTIIAHVYDKLGAGGGMAQRADEIPHLHDLKSDVITGTMTKQSVLVALSAILVVFVQQDSAATDYTAFVRWIASTGFLISIFLMLISVKTYDYASRFNWEEHSRTGGAAWCYYRIQLVNKAFRLDIIAFYFLLFTAIVATGLVERWLPIPVSLLCGTMLWTSYFFLRTEEPLGVASMKAHSASLSVRNAETAEKWYREKLSFAKNQRTGLLEKNGFAVEFNQVEATIPQGVAMLSFVVDDVEKAAKALKDQVTFVGEVQTDASKGIKQLIIKDQSEILLRFIQKIK